MERKFMCLKKKAVYQGGVLLLFVLLILQLTYIRLQENDTYCMTASETDYLQESKESEGDLVVAEGMQQVDLYPGTYELTVCAKTEIVDAAFQVIDVWSNTLLAEHEYTPGEEYHTVRFTTNQIYRDVVVRSVLKTDAGGNSSKEKNDSNEWKNILRIYGYTMTSDGTVCCDAEWGMILLLIFLILLSAGIHRMVQKRKPAFLALIILCAGVSVPFLSEHIPLGQDIQFHMSRICSLGIAIQNHQIPQRLTFTLGGSSISPIMYPEILLCGSGFMVAAGATVFLAYKVTCIFITFLTAFIAYCAVRSEASERTALIFAILYVINPYRMNELFLRAAIGEGLAMAFLPLIVVGMWQLLHGRERHGAMFLFVGYTGLLSSHVVMTVISAFFCAMYIIAEFVIYPRRIIKSKKCIVYLLTAVMACIGVNAWFLIPFLKYYGSDFSVSYVNVQYTASYLWQIFMGASVYGKNLPNNSANGEMSLTIGFVLLAGMVCYFMLCLVSRSQTIHKETKNVLTEKEIRCGNRCFFFGIVAIYLCSPYFPWSYINEHIGVWFKTLGQIQFAWRLLTYAAVLLCIVTAIAIHALMRIKSIPANLIAGGLLLFSLISGVHVATNYYSNPDYMNSRFDEELCFNFDYTFENVTNESITDDMLCGAKPESSGEVIIKDYHNQGINYWFSYKKKTEDKVQVILPVFWYGLHKAYLTETTDDNILKGDSVEITAEMNEGNQFTVVTLPAGSTEGDVQLVYEEPLLFRIGNGISIATIGGGAALAAVYIFRKKGREH